MEKYKVSEDLAGKTGRHFGVAGFNLAWAGIDMMANDAQASR